MKKKLFKSCDFSKEINPDKNYLQQLLYSIAGIKGFILKLNPDNTINIKSIKDSWTREEVKKLVKAIYTCNFSETFMKNVDEWIETNL